MPVIQKPVIQMPVIQKTEIKKSIIQPYLCRVYLRMLLICGAFVVMTPMLFTHAFNTVSYVHAEIVDNQILFPNLSNDSVSSHLFMAGYDDLRPLVLENISITNNSKLCTLDDFLTHTEDAFSDASYFFIATCPDNIENFIITDSFDLENIVYKVYNVNYKDTSFSYTGSPNIEIIAQITGNTMISITPISEKNTPIHSTPQFTQDDSQNIGQDTSQSANQDTSQNTSTNNAPTQKTSLFFLYLYLGLQHILSGLDHILFILGFILLATTFTGLLKGISGFTLSHSLTLTLAALSILTLSPKIVEPLIGLSIGIVGILAVFNIAKKWMLRFGIIFLFGLFHGLGFAGSIAEVGFPRDGFVLALLGFNLGIEAGQLLIVVAVFPLLVFIQKKSTRIHSYITHGIAVIITFAGLFWFVQRLFFSA